MTDTDSIESRVEKARKAYSAKDYTLAGKIYLDTAHRYELAGNLLSAAEMRNNGSVALLKAGKPDEALAAVKDTPVIFEQAGDTERRAMALANQAAAFEDLHRVDEALRDYRQAADLLKDTPASDMRSMILKRISTLQIKNGKPVHALAAMDASIDAGQKRSFGDRLFQSLMGTIRKLMGQA